MSEQDQNSPDNRRELGESESQENINAENGSTPETQRESTGEKFSPDKSGETGTGDDVNDATSGIVPSPEDEGHGSEPVPDLSVPDREPDAERGGEEDRDEAAGEVSPDAPRDEESVSHDEAGEASEESAPPADEQPVEMRNPAEHGEDVSPDPVSDDEPAAEEVEKSDVNRNADDAEEPAGTPEGDAETPQSDSEDHEEEDHVTAGAPEEAFPNGDVQPEQSEAQPAEPGGDETEAQEAGSSLEGLGEITEEDEAEGTEESRQREEVVDDLAHIIESIVFASDEPLPVSTIKSVLDAARTFGRVNPDMITGRISALNAKYDDEGTGFRIVEIANGFQYATRKEMAQWVSNLFKERSKRRLSNSALETVAIIAYKQPITKPEIESIRGVSVDYVLHNLLEKELVTVVGRAETVGRPLLYGTTQKFLKIFALKNLEDLPKLREIDEIIKEIKSKGAEESIQLEITALGDSSAPEQENTPGESAENGTE